MREPVDTGVNFLVPTDGHVPNPEICLTPQRKWNPHAVRRPLHMHAPLSRRPMIIPPFALPPSHRHCAERRRTGPPRRGSGSCRRTQPPTATATRPRPATWISANTEHVVLADPSPADTDHGDPATTGDTPPSRGARATCHAALPTRRKFTATRSPHSDGHQRIDDRATRRHFRHTIREPARNHSRTERPTHFPRVQHPRPACPTSPTREFNTQDSRA